MPKQVLPAVMQMMDRDKTKKQGLIALVFGETKKSTPIDLDLWKKSRSSPKFIFQFFPPTSLSSPKAIIRTSIINEKY